jgi:hypothetical protein
MRINNLIIIQEIRVPYTGKNRIRKTVLKLKCLCDCGRIFYPFKTNVFRGLTKKCKNCSSKKIILLGSEFGPFTVLKEIVEKHCHGTFYQVKCKCGCIYEKPYSLLRRINGNFCKECKPKKCKSGLSRKERSVITAEKKHNRHKNKIIGEKNGYLKILSFSHWNYDKKRRRAIYKAKCKCRKITYIRGDQFKYIKSCGCLHKECVMKGENQHEALLKNDEVLQIKELLKTGLYLQKEIAEMFNVNIYVISRIKKEKCYKDIK